MPHYMPYPYYHKHFHHRPHFYPIPYRSAEDEEDFSEEVGYRPIHGGGFHGGGHFGHQGHFGHFYPFYPSYPYYPYYPYYDDYYDGY